MRGALLGILLTSCAGPRIQVEVVRPATVLLPDSIERVALLSRPPPTGPEAAEHGADEVRAAAVHGLYERLGTTALSPRVLEVAPSTDNGPLTSAEVEALCTRSEADVLLVLEDLRVRDSLRVWGGEERVDASGRRPDVNWTAEREVDLWVHWSLYDPRQSQAIDELAERRPRWRVAAHGPNSSDAERRLGPPVDAYAEAAALAGVAYAERITPSRVVVERTLERGPGGALSRGNRLAQRGDWPGAEAAWGEATDDVDPVLRAAAWTNLAVAAEVAGSPSAAIAHLDRALALDEEPGRRRFRASLARRAVDEVAGEDAAEEGAEDAPMLAIPIGINP